MNILAPLTLLRVTTVNNNTSDRGIFISRSLLKENNWRKFYHIAQAHGREPQEYIKLLILKDILNFEKKDLSLIDRVIDRAGHEIKKYIGL